jgi:CheY-like chemotaxis protein
MYPGGRIELHATVADSIVEFRVKDKGMGIEATEVPKLFTLFSRIGNEGSQAQGGLGIGLALVRQLVTLHDGTVSVTSDGLDQGSEFIVRLPLSAGAVAVPDSDSVQELAADGQASLRRVLIADDNIDALETLAMSFELAGYSVRKAPDGMRAFHEASAWHPHFIMLDIGMPLMDGYEVARRIRAETWGKSPTLVAISGWGQVEDRERALDAGFDAHFAKPVSFDTLLQIVTAAPSAAAQRA